MEENWLADRLRKIHFAADPNARANSYIAREKISIQHSEHRKRMRARARCGGTF